MVVGNGYSIWADAIGETRLADLHLPASVREIYFVVEGGHRGDIVVPRPPSSFSRYGVNKQVSKAFKWPHSKTPQYKTGFSAEL